MTRIEAGAIRLKRELCDVQDVIETAIGGENIGTVIEGRQRFPIRVRYQQDFRNSLEALRNVLVPVNAGSTTTTEDAASGSRQMTRSPRMPDAGMVEGSSPSASGPRKERNTPLFRRGYVPLAQLATVRIVPGPPMISSEQAQLRSIVFLNVRGRDMGSFVTEAKETLNQQLHLPVGYNLQWSGQWENQIRAKQRLTILMPLVILIIFVMLYFVTKDTLEALVVMLSVPFALIGGVYLVYILGYNLSVAVWVGFIALYGLAVETGVVMVVYLHEALDRRLRDYERGTRAPLNVQDIIDATIEGSVLRLRPKIMTVATAMLALIPIMWSTGVGADVMQPLAAPMIGGLFTSAIHVLVVTPILFSYMKERALKKGALKKSHMTDWMKD